MSADPIIGASIGAVGGLISGIGQKRRDRLNQKRQHKYNKELAQYNFDNNLEQWNLQNAYNTPSAQMQRLKDAGINPHMAYAKGTPQNSAGAGPTMAQEGVDQSVGMAINPENILSQYQNFRSQNANINHVQKQAELTEKDKQLRETQNDLTTINVIGQGIANKYQQGNLDYQTQNLEQKLNLGKSQLLNDLINRSSTRAGIQNITAGTKKIKAETKRTGAQTLLTNAQLNTEKNKPALLKAQTTSHTKGHKNIDEIYHQKIWDKEFRNTYGLKPDASVGGMQMQGVLGGISQFADLISTLRESKKKKNRGAKGQW